MSDPVKCAVSPLTPTSTTTTTTTNTILYRHLTPATSESNITNNKNDKIMNSNNNNNNNNSDTNSTRNPLPQQQQLSSSLNNTTTTPDSSSVTAATTTTTATTNNNNNNSNNNNGSSTPASTINGSSTSTTATSITSTTTGAKSGTQLVFIHKLYGMLEDESINHLIWWCENSNATDSFLLIPNNEFSKLLSIYFKHSNIASFVRQLNMYGFHKVNDSSENTSSTNAPPTVPSLTTTTTGTPTPTSTSTQQQQQQQKQEAVSIWEFRHNSGFFKKGDMENLKNIKRRSSKNMTREINVKQIDRVQNYIPKSYEDDEYSHENNNFMNINGNNFNNITGGNNNEITSRLNELNYNYNLIKNEHYNLRQKYDLAMEDLKRTNFDLMTVLDLIKDLSNNHNGELETFVNNLKSSIVIRNSTREQDLSNLANSSHFNYFNTGIINNSNPPTSAPPLMNHYSRLNSLDSSSRDSIFMNKDIRYSSVSSSSKRHQSILYDPLTTDPFQSRQNSTTEVIRQIPQQTNHNGGTTSTTSYNNNIGPAANYASPISPSQVLPPQHQQPQQQQQPPPPHLSHRVQGQQQQQPTSSGSVMTYNSMSSSSTIPISSSLIPKNTSYTSLPQQLQSIPLPLSNPSSLPLQQQQPLSTTLGTTIETSTPGGGDNNNNNNNNNNNGGGGVNNDMIKKLEGSIDSPYPIGPTPYSSSYHNQQQHLQMSQSALGLNKLQSPFESHENNNINNNNNNNNNNNMLRRGRSDSISDRLLFKRSKS